MKIIITGRELQEIGNFCPSDCESCKYERVCGTLGAIGATRKSADKWDKTDRASIKAVVKEFNNAFSRHGNIQP